MLRSGTGSAGPIAREDHVMTATTLSPDLVSRSWNGLLRLALAVAVLAVLVVGSFAIGRSTADTGHPAVNARSDAVPANVADPASCGHTAHTPPC